MANFWTALGNLTNWLNPWLNPREHKKKQIANLERQVEYLETLPDTPENSARHVQLELDLNELRQELENLRD